MNRIIAGLLVVLSFHVTSSEASEGADLYVSLRSGGCKFYEYDAHNLKFQQLEGEANRPSGCALISDWGNDDSNDPSEIDLSKLVPLLSEHKIRGISFDGWRGDRTDLENIVLVLSSYKDLDTLNLNSTPIGPIGLSHLVDLPNLKKLDLSLTHISDEDLRQVAKITSLQILHLKQMDDLNGTTLLNVLASLKNLRSLSLTSSFQYLKTSAPFQDDSFEFLCELKNLRRFDGSGWIISDKTLGHLANARNIEAIDVSSARVTDEGLIMIRGLHHLESLSVGNGIGALRVTDRGVQALADMPELSSLELIRSSVTGATFGVFTHKDVLKHLDLFGAPVTDKDIDYIVGFTGLEFLNLGDTLITENVLPKLENLKKLQWLGLPKGFNQASVSSWKRKTKIQEVFP